MGKNWFPTKKELAEAKKTMMNVSNPLIDWNAFPQKIYDYIGQAVVDAERPLREQKEAPVKADSEALYDLEQKAWDAGLAAVEAARQAHLKAVEQAKLDVVNRREKFFAAIEANMTKEELKVYDKRTDLSPETLARREADRTAKRDHIEENIDRAFRGMPSIEEEAA